MEENRDGSTNDGNLIPNEDSACDTGNSDCKNAVNFLFNCYNGLKQPIEDSTGKQIADCAQLLIDSLNKKRQNDTQLLEEYKHALNTHIQTMVELLQEKLFKVHESHNQEVNEKLVQLFSCLDSVSASQNDLDEFKESLRALYDDMQSEAK